VPSERNPETNSTQLKRMIIGQSVAGTAVPMVLFGDDALIDVDGPAGHPEAVSRAAADLGIDLDALELFSFDAYRLQSAVGEGLTP
jgi:hypothetical protein